MRVLSCKSKKLDSSPFKVLQNSVMNVPTLINKEHDIYCFSKDDIFSRFFGRTMWVISPNDPKNFPIKKFPEESKYSWYNICFLWTERKLMRSGSRGNTVSKLRQAPMTNIKLIWAIVPLSLQCLEIAYCTLNEFSLRYFANLSCEWGTRFSFFLSALFVFGAKGFEESKTMLLLFEDSWCLFSLI